MLHTFYTTFSIVYIHLLYCQEVSGTLYGPYAEDVSGHDDEVMKYESDVSFYCLQFTQDSNVHN